MQFFVGLAIGLGYGVCLWWTQWKQAEWLEHENKRLRLVARPQRKATERRVAHGRASFNRLCRPSQN